MSCVFLVGASSPFLGGSLSPNVGFRLDGLAAVANQLGYSESRLQNLHTLFVKRKVGHRGESFTVPMARRWDKIFGAEF